MSLLKVNEVQIYNGSSLTLTASTVSTSAQLNTGGNISVTGSINVSDDSTTRSNLGLGSIATQDSNNVTITGGNISNATLANTVIFTDEYYVQGKLSSNYTAFANNSQINFDGSTAPYWVLTGDTTNFVQGTLSSDLKIIKSGIYLIVVNISARLPNTDGSERSMSVLLRGVGTGSTSVISGSSGQVIEADGGTASGSATVSAVRNFNANDQINIYVESTSQGNIDLHQESHFSICLIRPL